MKSDIRKAPSYTCQVEKCGFASVKMQNASRNRWLAFFKKRNALRIADSGFQSCFVDKAVLDRDDRIVLQAKLVDQGVHPLVNIAFFHLAVVWNDEIKNEVGVRWALHHTEIMDGKARVNAPDDFNDLHA